MNSFKYIVLRRQVSEVTQILVVVRECGLHAFWFVLFLFLCTSKSNFYLLMLVRYRVYSGPMVLKQQQQQNPNPTKQTDGVPKWSSQVRELFVMPLLLLPSPPKTPKFSKILVAFWAPAYTGDMTFPCHSTDVHKVKSCRTWERVNPGVRR